SQPRLRQWALRFGLPVAALEPHANDCEPVHFSAPINAFTASSDGQQQRSTPLFGSGASMSISTGQPVIGALLSRSVLTLLLTIIDGKKTSVFVAFGRGAETNASALVALSDVFVGGVVERGRARPTWGRAPTYLWAA